MHLFNLIVVAAAALAASENFEYSLKERHAVPPSFVRESDAPSLLSIRLQLHLKQHRFDELQQHLLEISDPEHDRYGKYLTVAEIDGLIRPHDNSLKHVHEWLDHEQIEAASLDYGAGSDVLSLTVPVAQAEKMLDTKFSVYRHVEDGSRLIRAPEWKLPKHLHDHIITIQPTTSFLRNAPETQTWLAGEASNALGYPELARTDVLPRDELHAPLGQVCNSSAVTPLCLRHLYGMINYMPQVPGQNKLGVTNFRNQVNNRSDIGIFLDQYRPEAAAAAEEFELISVNGGTVQQTPLNESQLRILLGGEGDLDVEYQLGLAWPTPLVSWSVAGAPPFIPDADSKNYTEIEPYMAWLDYILQQDSIPQVISNSYADDEQTVPPEYARAVCSKFAQLAARGVSFLTGSGDGGVGGTMPGGACLSNKDNSTKQFIPQFPSTCPYVTSVGGTTQFDPEVAAYDLRFDYASGGGFSNYFQRPAFQAQTVDAYLANTLGESFQGLYNASGRAYPDIAAYSTNITQVWNGTVLHIDGTSAATPVAAAIISLVNDALLAADKPVLGWLNPWLYKRGKQGFKDVVSGSASGCNTTGFLAAEGWDPVTGWGAPRFEKLLKAAGLNVPFSVGDGARA